ncbi:MAG: ABC transporter ATP-binding protein [Planctomycetota bacterium]|jgi:putative ABC transport system ATP-binding protein|nr:ABC transporter ATP-binding protein [Planctomycetota bacterium]
MDEILQLRGVSMVYGQVRALSGVDLSIGRGEWLAVMGPSGSGKTTLMNIIGCLASPTHGSVILDGQDLSRIGPRELTAIRRDKIGLVFQQFHLVSHLTAVENVMMAQYYHSLADEGEAMAALRGVGLAERARHLPKQLSGGEQQRVCIARALINHPRLILADEPTGNLDEANEKIVLDILGRRHAAGDAIIVVTHDAEVAERAERIIVLEHGRIAQPRHHHHHRLPRKRRHSRLDFEGGEDGSKDENHHPHHHIPSGRYHSPHDFKGGEDGPKDDPTRLDEPPEPDAAAS